MCDFWLPTGKVRLSKLSKVAKVGLASPRRRPLGFVCHAFKRTNEPQRTSAGRLLRLGMQLEEAGGKRNGRWEVLTKLVSFFLKTVTSEG